jgi:hypothetical protein
MSLSSRSSSFLSSHGNLASKSRQCLLRVCLLGLVGIGIVPVGKGQSKQTSSTVPPASVSQLIFSPLAGIKDFDKWEIEIANRSDEDVPATVTAYSGDGEPFSPFPIQLGRNQINRLDIRNLLTHGSQHQSQGKDRLQSADAIGGITVEAVARPFAIAAQVTLSNHRGGFGNIDSILLPDAMFLTSTMDAVWWQPEGGQSFLILANSSTNGLTAEVTFGSGQRETVTLAAKATRLLAAPDLRHNENNQSVHVVGSSAPGTLRVSGYAVSEPNAFLDVIRAYDPAVSTGPTVYANGLHFSDAENHLVVKNLTGSPMNVWGTIYPLSSSNSVQNVEVPKKFLTPYASAELDLPSSSDALDGAALKLESSGGAASFVASYVSHAQVNHMTRSMPFKDIGDRANTRGGYPWRLDGNYESHTYITNVGKVRAAFGAFIDPKNGDRYVIDTHFLEPGETTIIDYRKLRDEQTPDRNGVVLPKKVDSGAVQWFPLFFDGSQYFIGRTEVLDSSTGVASSFSCGSCPCSPNVNSAYTSPSSVNVSVGGTVPITVRATMNDPCNINPIPDMTFIPTSWSTPPYFTLTAGSTPSILRGVSAGSGLYITSFITDDWVYNGPFQNPQCSSTQRINTPEGTGTVPPTITGPNTVWYFGGQQQSGYATSVTLTSSGGAQTSWSVTAGANRVNLSTTVGGQTTITSTGSAFSSTVGDIKITATINSATSTPFAITSRTPNRLVPGTITTNCDGTYGYVSRLTYTIKDNLLALLPSPVDVNEFFTTGVVNDFAGTNWTSQPANGVTGVTTFGDQIQGQISSRTPVASCTGASTPVQHWGQEIRVGSATTGLGRRVQKDTLQKYINHAAHNSIVSPAP